MTTHPMLELCRNRLDATLIQTLDIEAPDFRERLQQAAKELPDELARPLREIATAHEALLAADNPDSEAMAGFCFACGILHEQLRAHAQARLEVENTIMGPASVSPSALQPGQSDVLSRFIETRDRLFRKTADWTLKFLLIGLALLALGLAIGVI